MNVILAVALVVIALLLGVAIGYIVRLFYAKYSLTSAEEMAKRILSEANAKAESKVKEGLLEVRERMENERRKFETETSDRRRELKELERRMTQKEESLDRKLDILDKKERDLRDREQRILVKEKEVTVEEEALKQKKAEQIKILERLANMSSEDAKRMLMQTLEEEAKLESAQRMKVIEQETRDTADKKAKEIIALAIQRCAGEHTAEITVSSVNLPNDEIKGRIIGREGRNIRAFEQATGVDLVVDDTPESITLSSFDGFRREVARVSLEKLITDGRIHPARIEEVVAKTKKEMETQLVSIGEEAALEAGVPNLPKEVLELLGRLKFRTSYGQNQLQHTKEVTWLAGVLAGELRVDIKFAKRAGLMHDLGKAIDHTVEGTHHQLSADIAKKYGESEKMINAILAHHEGIVEPKSIEAVIIMAADAISAARPGARRETLEHYLKRVDKLEKIASSFRGVENAYAIQAGREVRIIVEPEDIDDSQTTVLAKDIAKKIEQELEFPGQIKVTVIRETRAVETAK
ncbi:MAG: ribonuclease Y [Elusimicrobiota bacterium]